LAGNLNIVGEIQKVFGGGSRLCCGCALCYCGCDDVDHCTEVQDCEILLFRCVPLGGNTHMLPCMIALLNIGLTMSMAWL